MSAGKCKPSFSLLPRQRPLIDAEAKASVGVAYPVCILFSSVVDPLRFYFSRAVQLDGSECMQRLFLSKMTCRGIIFPDRADANRKRLGGRGREQQSAGTRATGHDLHQPARETGLPRTFNGETRKMAPSAAEEAGIASAAFTRV